MNASVASDGKVLFVTDASGIRDVCMEPVASPGNVSVKKDGVDSSVTRIWTSVRTTSPVKMEDPVTILARVHTPVDVHQTLSEKTVRRKSLVVTTNLAKMGAHVP